MMWKEKDATNPPFKVGDVVRSNYPGDHRERDHKNWNVLRTVTAIEWVGYITDTGWRMSASRGTCCPTCNRSAKALKRMSSGWFVKEPAP